MGNSQSKKRVQLNEVDAQLEAEQKSDRPHKVLFLGTGGSGKSTFIKQITQKYGKGFDEKERLWWRNQAQQNVFESMLVLCESGKEMAESGKYGISVTSIYQKSSLLDEINIKSARLDNVDDLDNATHSFQSDWEYIRDIFNDELQYRSEGCLIQLKDAQCMKRLLKTDIIQTAYKNRGDFPFDFGDIKYFYDKIDDLANEEYIMTDIDITYCRAKTVGIQQMQVEMQGIPMIFIDVAGQKSNRKKWIGCFSDVTSVIWVSGLDNYNEVLAEDPTLNAMADAMEAFEWAVNHPMLKDPSFTLFLNKIDVLERKIKDFPLNNFFEEYDGEPQNVHESAAFIEALFLSCVPPTRKVPAFSVQGTDPDNAQKVLDSVIFGLLNDAINDNLGI